MRRFTPFYDMFKRHRRQGDVVFAFIFMIFCIVLFINIPSQLMWKDGLALGKQPALWPTISVSGMVVFSLLHWLSSALSPRIEGRWKEVWAWVKSLEFVGWFVLYALGVGLIGYLLATCFLCVVLSYRSGFRGKKTLTIMAVFGVVTVLLFKSFLHVKIPGGWIYEFLPTALRSFALSYL